MARIDLPSGAWVDYRDQLMAGDKFAVQSSIIMTFQQSGAQEIGGGIQNQLRNALLKQIITGWSYESVPIPSVNPAGIGCIDTTMTIEDYNALSEAVDPLLTKVSFTPPPKQSTS